MQTLPQSPEHIERYNKLPWWAQLLIRFESIRTIWLPGAPFLLGCILGFIHPIFPFLGIVGSAAYIYAALRFVKPKVLPDGEEEPQFALWEVLKLRLPIVFDEGFCLIIPGISRIILRSKQQFNEPIEVKGVGCRLEAIPLGGKNPKQDPTFFQLVAHAFKMQAPANIQIGGSVTVKIQATFELDYQDGWAMIDYDNVGERPGAVEIMKGQVDQDVREVGRLLTWLQLKFATDLVSAHIIANLAVNTPEYDPKKVFSRPTPASIQEFLAKALINGVSYMRGLGIKVKRMQILEVRGEGKLEEEAEKASIELLRTQGLLLNTDGLIEAVGRMKAKMNDSSMTDKVLLDAVLVNDPDAKVERKISDINVNADSLNRLGDTVVRLVQGLVTPKPEGKAEWQKLPKRPPGRPRQ